MSSEKRRKITITVRGKEKSTRISEKHLAKKLNLPQPHFATDKLAHELDVSKLLLDTVIMEMSEISNPPLSLKAIRRSIEQNGFIIDSYSIIAFIPNSLVSGITIDLQQKSVPITLPRGVDLMHLDYTQLTDIALKRRYHADTYVQTEEGVFDPKYIVVALKALKIGYMGLEPHVKIFNLKKGDDSLFVLFMDGHYIIFPEIHERDLKQEDVIISFKDYIRLGQPGYGASPRSLSIGESVTVPAFEALAPGADKFRITRKKPGNIMKAMFEAINMWDVLPVNAKGNVIRYKDGRPIQFSVTEHQDRHWECECPEYKDHKICPHIRSVMR
jgi:hypothetical protein